MNTDKATMRTEARSSYDVAVVERKPFSIKRVEIPARISEDTLGENARLAWQTIRLEPTRGIPSSLVYTMDIPLMEQISGRQSGDYKKNPEKVYLDFHRKIGTCAIDQFLALNPLTMTVGGYDSHTERTATTGTDGVVYDGITIDSPEAVVEHLEKFVFPALKKESAQCDINDPAAVNALIEQERRMQQLLGPDILKIPYEPYDKFQSFPRLRYKEYGYENYFMAYALYPDVMEKDFSLQADLAVKRNTIAASAFELGNLPKLLRLDHDMADSRGMLVNIKSLDSIWLPHFCRAAAPLLKAGIRLIWHCDGNLMDLFPRLIQAGIGGFQGFQYEDGMDYVNICKMKDRNNEPLLIWAGVSVTRTLPFGTSDDVRKEINWLVENGPKQGLSLGVSSSAAPGIRHENIKTMINGFQYYRKYGRN